MYSGIYHFKIRIVIYKLYYYTIKENILNIILYPVTYLVYYRRCYYLFHAQNKRNKNWFFWQVESALIEPIIYLHF